MGLFKYVALKFSDMLQFVLLINDLESKVHLFNKRTKTVSELDTPHMWLIF